MRPVLMTTDAVGGVWRYSLDLGRALRGRGFAPTLAVMGPAPAAAQLDEARLARIPVVHGNYRLEWMSDAAADVQRAGRWLLALAGTLRPDIVHLNGYAHAALPWARPVVVVAHSCVRTWWRAVRGETAPATARAYTDSVRAGLQSAGLVVAPTAAMLRAIQAEYGVPAYGAIIPNGSERAGSTHEDAGRDKAPIVLAAGRLWDDAKNIAALCAIADRLPWQVCVAGDPRGPDGGERRLPAVHALGQLTPTEMQRWYDRAAIYALPARYEPFGLSVLEAATAGCALVLGDIASLRENWDGAALFVPPDDRDALASAIRTLIERPAARAAFAWAARERARQFPIDRTADAYARAYEALAA